MSRRSELPQTPRHVLVFDEDWEFLLRFFDRGAGATITPGQAIRQLIHKHVKALREREIAARNSRLPAGDLDQ